MRVDSSPSTCGVVLSKRLRPRGRLLLKISDDEQAFDGIGRTAKVEADESWRNASGHVLARQRDDGDSSPEGVGWQGCERPVDSM